MHSFPMNEKKNTEKEIKCRWKRNWQNKCKNLREVFHFRCNRFLIMNFVSECEYAAVVAFFSSLAQQWTKSLQQIVDEAITVTIKIWPEIAQIHSARCTVTLPFFEYVIPIGFFLSRLCRPLRLLKLNCVWCAILQHPQMAHGIITAARCRRTLSVHIRVTVQHGDFISYTMLSIHIYMFNEQWQDQWNAAY